MKNSKLMTATAIFSIAITAALTTMSITSAYRGQEIEQGMRNGNPQISEETRDAIHTALENKDYEAWLELVPANGKNANMTETEFLEFAEQQLEKISAMEENRAKMEERLDAIEEALDNLDYEAWYEIMSENERSEKLLETINENNFPKYVEMHNLKQEGVAKFKEAKKIAEELGIERGDGMGKVGLGKGMMKGHGDHFRRKGFEANSPTQN